jgi:hypothetical protein
LAFQGCQAPIIPNANIPADSVSIPPTIVRQQLSYASDMLNDRVARREMSDDQARLVLAQAASDLIARIDSSEFKPQDIWEYADFCRTAQKWATAEKALRIAVKSAVSEDRRINDTLRLAQCVAKQHRAREAVEIANTVLNAVPGESAPILPAVLLEIAPAAQGQGADLELAQLLVKAIHKHLATVVDPNTESGFFFIQARPFHIKKAKELAIKLFESTGHHQEALAVAKITCPRSAEYRLLRPNIHRVL